MLLKLLAIFLAVNVGVDGRYCQTWKLQRAFRLPWQSRVVFLGCESTTEKHGTCPTGCQFRNPNLELSRIACNSDLNCYPGYKCCLDPCVSSYRICRPAYQV